MGNDADETSTRSAANIIRANTLTRFNLIITCLAAVVLVFGDPIDASFGLIMIINSAIGVSQELRAKRTLDGLRVLLVPSVSVIRDGELHDVAPDQLVMGDAIKLESGDQVPVDGQVLASRGLEADESALTGESNPVAKPAGAEVLSGSFIVAGAATVEATAVGSNSWARKITAEAKDFVLTKSELQVGIDRLIATIGWLLLPMSALLVWSQLRAEASVAQGLVSAVAGVVALVPQGLVLLVSMTFAIAVIRLGRHKVVVQELPAVEGLARVDVLCVDKTGTLTTGRLSLDLISGIEDDESTVRSGLAALTQLDTARSATTETLREMLGDEIPNWLTTESVPFSSARKWSGVTFNGQGTWILGAPEILLDVMDGPETKQVRSQVDGLAEGGRRVLLLARGAAPLTDGQLPCDLWPSGLVALKEEVRPDAAKTIQYFRQQHVEIKVISGDNPRTVAAVAAELGIEAASRYVDMRSAGPPSDISSDATVFGRVLPEQKRDIVRLLQSQGRTVAMTGDGVNDIPSLKAANIGIAMNTATAATKASAQIVLLDGRFSHLPDVVGEGRRVIKNMERVSSLFVTKTVYAILLAIVVGVGGVSFPFLPRHLSLIGALTIGIPGFALSFPASDEPCKAGYLRRVLRFSVPAGVVAATATLTTFWAARNFGNADLVQARTAATMAMTLTGLWILYRLVRPLDVFKTSLIASLLLLLVLTFTPAPWSDFYALDLPPLRTTTVIIGVLVGSVALLQSLLTLNERR